MQIVRPDFLECHQTAAVALVSDRAACPLLFVNLAPDAIYESFVGSARIGYMVDIVARIVVKVDVVAIT